MTTFAGMVDGTVPPPNTHTWMAKWCGVANVLRLLCASTLAWSLHFATPFVCVPLHQPSVCHHPFHHPFAFLSLTLFWCVCVALSSGIHALFVAVDALALASVPLIWGTPCLPSTIACVCVVMAFLPCPGPVNHLPPFLCVSLVCSSSHCFNLH